MSCSLLEHLIVALIFLLSLQDVIESGREILLWEKRIQLAEEMKATLKGDNDTVRRAMEADYLLILLLEFCSGVSES